MKLLNRSVSSLTWILYCKRIGLVKGNKVVLSNFKFDERRGEEAAFKTWFEQNGFDVLLVSKSFEGEGDALFVGDLLVCGYGFRSEKPAFEEIKKHLNIKDTIFCELVDPRFYHLDTCFLSVGRWKKRCIFLRHLVQKV